MALQLQSRHKTFCPLHWATAATGHVQSGESYETAALRELQEEIGTRAKVSFAGKYFYEAEQGAMGIKKFLAVFIATYNGPFSANPLEVKKVEFFSPDEIRSMINSGEKFHPELLFLLKKHFGL